MFPDHPALVVDMVTFALIMGISFVSAGLAFRVQYAILAVIVASLIAIVIPVFQNALTEPINWFGSFPGSPEDGFQGTGFWYVFAVFFPATTGIMAGANMSGELKNPKRSIPVGTLGAIGLSLVIYVGVAYLLARMASPEELTANYTILVDKAFWGPAVLAGILGATFSSGLASFVGAPRILQALGSHRILPMGPWLSERTESGEPRNALIITGVIVFFGLLLRDLNAIAPLITMFFLITYLMINAVVLMEQSLSLISFRPEFRVPTFVPFLGFTGCLFAMFIVNPVFSLVAISFVTVVYVFLLRASLNAPFGDMRSGLFVAMAEWAGGIINRMPSSQERAWKPNLLVPVESPGELLGSYRTILDVASPKGSVKVFAISSRMPQSHLNARIPYLSRSFEEDGISARSAVIESNSYRDGVRTVIQTMKGITFQPNILFLTLLESEEKGREIINDQTYLIDYAEESNMGAILYGRHPKAGVGRRRDINLWFSSQEPEWKISTTLGHQDLALLTAFKIHRQWNGALRIITTVSNVEQEEQAREYMKNLKDLCRMPGAEIQIIVGDFDEAVAGAPTADLDIFGMPENPNRTADFFYGMLEKTESSCLYVRDSGQENAMA